MKHLILVSLILATGTVQAAVDGKAIFGSIFEIIFNEIVKDNQPTKPGKPSTNKNKKVILKDSGDKLVLGRVFITEDKGVDQVVFPDCDKFSGNKRVNRLRFYTAGADVYVDSFNVTFQNGGTQTVTVDDMYTDGDGSKWFNLKGNVGRCIQKIRLIGEVEQQGWNNNGGWDGQFKMAPNGALPWDKVPGGNGGGYKPGKPGNHGPGGNGNKEDRAVINFVGQKA